MRNTESFVYIVRWNHFAANSFLYGTSLDIHEDGSVSMDNQLMPPGVVIKEWYSKTNYQMKMIEPDLPLLKRGCKYRLYVYAKTIPSDRLIVRLTFYDGQDTVVGISIIEKEKGDFTVPKGTIHYTMQLVQSGFTHLDFNEITMLEIKEPE